MNRFKSFVKTERANMHEIKSKKADDKFPEKKAVEADKKTVVINELKMRLKTETDKNQEYIMDIHRLKEERERLYRPSDEENKLLISLFIMMTEMSEKEIRSLCSGAIDMHAIKKN
eukprot:118074_1